MNKLKIKNIMFLGLLISLISSCSLDSSESETSDIETLGSSSSYSSSSEDVILSDALYEEFWNPASNIEVKLDFYNDSLIYLDNYGGTDPNTAKADIYFPADLTLTLNNKTYFYKEVGVRKKGNTSRSMIFDNGKYNGGTLHYKIDFHETFSDASIYKGEIAKFYHDWTGDVGGYKIRDDRLFAGMEKIDLKYNRIGDPTFLREVYARHLFRSSGIISPNGTLGKTVVVHNGTQVVCNQNYQFLEVIDKKLLRHFLTKEESQGDLYKLGWGSLGDGTWEGANFAEKGAVVQDNNGNYVAGYTIGVEDKFNNEYFIYDLKTNKKTTSNSSLVNFIHILNKKYSDYGNSTDYYADLEGILDLEYFAKYEAICFFLGNPDDVRNNHNNAYIYFNPVNNLAYFIPYDFDQCLGFLPRGDDLTTYWPTTTKYQGYYRYNNAEIMDMALYYKTILIDSNDNDDIRTYSSQWPSSSVSKSFYKETLYSFKTDERFTSSYFNNFLKQFVYASSYSDKQQGSFIKLSTWIEKKLSSIDSDERLSTY